MHPEENTGSDTTAELQPDSQGEERGEGGLPPTPSDPGRSAAEAGGTEIIGEADDGPHEGIGEEKNTDDDKGHQGGNGAPASAAAEARAKNRRISGQTFRAACIAGNGNRVLIAAATGLSKYAVADRIRLNPELNSLYGDGHAEMPATAPAEMGLLNRNTDDLPAHVAVEIGHVSPDDMTQYYTALKAYGVSDERIKKLKSLDGLADNWATHVSISLRGHHQSYDGQLHNLAEVAENIKKRLDGVKNDDGTITQLDAESYSYLSKVYVECVKEAGKGVGMMLTLTEALVRMIGASKNDGAPTKAVSGWGPQKKVRKAIPA